MLCRAEAVDSAKIKIFFNCTMFWSNDGVFLQRCTLAHLWNIKVSDRRIGVPHSESGYICLVVDVQSFIVLFGY